MARSPKRQPPGITTGGQFATDPRPETEVGLTAPVAADDVVVTIDDPDDPFGTPLYEGRAGDATRVLAPGTYAAVGLDDNATAWTVVVPDAPTAQQEPELAPVVWSGTSTRDHLQVLHGSVDGTEFEAVCEASEDPADPYTMRVLVDGKETGSTYRMPSPSTLWRVFTTDGSTAAPTTAASRDEALSVIVATAGASRGG